MLEAIKIFNMDDCTWIAAANLDDAWRAFADFYGYGSTASDVERARADSSSFEPEELTSEDLERLRFVDDNGSTRTFKEELDIMAARGDKFPCFFATTEY